MIWTKVYPLHLFSENFHLGFFALGKAFLLKEVNPSGTWLGLPFFPFCLGIFFFPKGRSCFLEDIVGVINFSLSTKGKFLFPQAYFLIHFIVEGKQIWKNDKTLDLWFEGRDLTTRFSFPCKYRVLKDN